MSCGAGRLRASGSGGTIVRDQAQENLRAHADADATKAYQEKVDGGNVPNTQTNRYGRKVAYAQTDGHAGKIRIVEEEKILSKSDTFRNPNGQSVGLHEKEKVFAEPISGIFFDRFEQEKETKVVPDTQPVARGIAGSVALAGRETRRQRNAEAISFPVPEEEGCAGHDLCE
jgi:hypothetical protein